MSNVSQWSTTASSNNSTPPDGWPEGQAPSTVNDSARENMAAIAKWYGDLDGTLTSGGSSNAYTLTTNQTHAALADQSMLVFRANFANTGAATLNVDSLGAKSIKKAHDRDLASGDIEANQIVIVSYNATDDTYELISGASAGATQAEMEAGTATNVATTPGRQHFHPSASKGWVKCGTSGNILASYNVSSVTDTGVGRATVNWDTDFSGADYSVVLTLEAASNRFPLVASIAAGSVLLKSDDENGSASDPASYHAIAFGDHA